MGAAGWTCTKLQLALRGIPQAFLFKAHIFTYYSGKFAACKEGSGKINLRIPQKNAASACLTGTANSGKQACAQAGLGILGLSERPGILGVFRLLVGGYGQIDQRLFHIAGLQ